MDRGARAAHHYNFAGMTAHILQEDGRGGGLGSRGVGCGVDRGSGAAHQYDPAGMTATCCRGEGQGGGDRSWCTNETLQVCRQPRCWHNLTRNKVGWGEGGGCYAIGGRAKGAL